MTNGIVIESYNPIWSEVFEDLKLVIKNELGDLALSIEHVGSTSVKGLSAKPIIDLDVVIDHENLLPNVIKQLEKLGYYHEGNLGIDGREAFARTNHHVPKDGGNKIWMEHHLYVCTKNNEELKRHLAFRNYLRENPDALIAYENLKKNLALNAKDRASYTLGKGDFINSIIKNAL